MLVKSVGKGVVVSANWMKSQKGNFLKATDIAGDFLGVKDAYILATRKDWHGNKRSRAEAAMWLAVGFTPVGKAAKGAKMAGKAIKGSKAPKAVTKNIKVNPALRAAFKHTKIKLGKARPGVKKVIRKIPQPVKTVWVMSQKVVNGRKQFIVTPIKIVQIQVVKKNRIIRVSNKSVQKAKAKKTNAPRRTTNSLDIEAKKYWNKRVKFNGHNVYQRNDLIDPKKQIRDKHGNMHSNLENMKQGKAPVGTDGKVIQLHHITQRNESALAEISNTLHTKHSKTIHINSNKTPSGITRNEFNKYRSAYWKNRANDFS